MPVFYSWLQFYCSVCGADKIGEVVFNVIGSTPIMAVAVVYFSIWMYAGCVMLKVCPTVQALGLRLTLRYHFLYLRSIIVGFPFSLLVSLLETLFA